MSEFINGIRVTINIREDTSKTNYKNTYGKMIPGKSYIFIDAKYEIKKGVEFIFGQIVHGNAASSVGWDRGVENFGESEYYLGDPSTLHKITKPDGSKEMTFTSYSIPSRQMDEYGINNYVMVNIQTENGGSLDFHTKPFSEFDMFPYVDPSIEFINAVRNKNNSVNLHLKMKAYLRNGFNNNESMTLYIKKQSESSFEPIELLNIEYQHSIDYNNGELYEGFIKVGIPPLTDDTYVAYITYETLGKKFTFLQFLIPAKYQLICFGKDGNAIAFGKICEQNGFENNLDSWFHKPTHFTDQVNFTKPPNGIPSDSIIIKSRIESSEMIESGFENIFTSPLALQDNKTYPYKQTFWLLPEIYGKTTNDFMNNATIELFLDEPCNGICPRIYYREYAGSIDIRVLSIKENIQTTGIMFRVIFSDVFIY